MSLSLAGAVKQLQKFDSTTTRRKHETSLVHFRLLSSSLLSRRALETPIRLQRKTRKVLRGIELFPVFALASRELDGSSSVAIAIGARVVEPQHLCNERSPVGLEGTRSVLSGSCFHFLGEGVTDWGRGVSGDQKQAEIYEMYNERE